LPPVHTYEVGEPDEHTAVKVIATPFVPVLGPCIVHPDGAFETTQVNTWLPAGPLSEKLSQFESLSVMPPACAARAHEKNAAPANTRTACRIQDRIILTPIKGRGKNAIPFNAMSAPDLRIFLLADYTPLSYFLNSVVGARPSEILNRSLIARELERQPKERSTAGCSPRAERSPRHLMTLCVT